jgi:ATPase family associated with various cellular activities (AAA)
MKMTDRERPAPVGSFVLKQDEGDPEDGGQPMQKFTPMSLSTEIEWARSGTKFYAQPCADKFPKLPGGVYRFVAPPMQPWFLERSADRFEFPFKVYNASGEVIQRICKHWAFHGGSLGVLMNGLRGAGKSVTAKLTANRLLDETDLPILVIREPIPLDVVFDNVQQHLVVIFDEFEKSHNEQLYPGCQQKLLSTIDGMSRSEFNRLILFTTNSTDINENFKDRPSRIHYKFEFSRVADEIIEGLISDMLPENLLHLKDDIFQYLNTRDICTIDIVRAVIKEVVTFEESPAEFEDMLNVEKGVPPSYTVQIVDPETNSEIKLLSSFWKLGIHERHLAALLGGSRRAVEQFAEDRVERNTAYNPYDGMITLALIEPCMEEDEKGYFLAKISVPITRTFWDKYDTIKDGYGGHTSLWMDARPEDWKSLPSLDAMKKDEDGELQDHVYHRFHTCQRTGSTVYGTGKPSIFKIRIVPNKDRAPTPTVMGQWMTGKEKD